MSENTPSSLLSGSTEPKLIGFRQRVVAIYTLLAIANIGAWIWAIAAFIHQPVLLGTALLAYSLGLRHAIDADHIAAIDNVTRKLMQEGQRPAAQKPRARRMQSRPDQVRVTSSRPSRQSTSRQT